VMKKGSDVPMKKNEERFEPDFSEDSAEKKAKEVIEISKAEYEHLKEQDKLAKRYLSSLHQIQADFENFRRIAEKNKEHYIKYGNENIIKKLIRINDDLIRAVQMAKSPKDENITLNDYETLHAGLRMIQENLSRLLDSEGVKPINAKGKPFDPYEHEVMYVEDTTGVPDNTCLEELENGYYFKDKVIRPSKVKVSRYNKQKSEEISV